MVPKPNLTPNSEKRLRRDNRQSFPPVLCFSSSLNQIPKHSRNRTFLGVELSSAGYHLLAFWRGISLVPEPNVTDLFDIVVLSVVLVFVVGSYRGSC